MATRIGTLTLSPMRIQDDTIPLPVAYSDEIEGGLHSGETIADRNSLKSFYRKWGMRYSVYNDGANTGMYELTYGREDTDLSNNNNWVNVTGLNEDTLPDNNRIISGGIVTVLQETDVEVALQMEATVYEVAKQEYTVAIQEATITKPTSKNRIDLIYLDSGGLKILQGVAAQSPLKPKLPPDCIELGFMLFTSDSPVEVFDTNGGPLLYTIPAGYLLEKVLIKAGVDVNAGAETTDAPGSENIIVTQAIPAAEGAVWLINKMAWNNSVSINVLGLPVGVKVYFIKKKILN